MKVSVIIPTYKSAQHIRKAVESATSQVTDFEFEVLVRDDMSEDGSYEILRDIAAADPRVRTWRPFERLGAVGNIEFLRACCTGEYVAYLDGDDFYSDPGYLQLQVDFLDSHPGYAMHCAAYDTVYEDGRLRWAADGDEPYYTHPHFPVLTTPDLLQWNYVTFGRMWRNIAIDTAWMADTYFYDWAFNFEMSKHGAIACSHRVAGAYRYTWSGMITSMSQDEVDRRNVEFRGVLAAKYAEYCDDRPDPMLRTLLPTEMYAQQTWHVVEAFPKVLPMFEQVIEIGTLAGAFTDWLAWHVEPGCEIISYDIQPDLRVAGPRPNVDYRVGDCMSEPTLSEVRALIARPKRTLVLCDGQDKHLELSRYAEYIKPGDVIMCHDYGHDPEDFLRVGAPIGWPNKFPESRYDQVRDAVARYGLEPFHYDMFKGVMWGSFRKPDAAENDADSPAYLERGRTAPSLREPHPTDRPRVITVIDSYMSTPEVERLTAERISALRSAGLDVMLVTNTPPPIEIAGLANYCLYDAENRLFDTTAFEYLGIDLWYGTESIRFHTIVNNVQRHGLSVLRNMTTALSTARSLGYTHFQRVEADDIMGDDAIRHMLSVPAACEAEGKRGLFYKNASDVSFHYFYCEIQHFLMRVPPVNTTEDYARFLEGTYGNRVFRLVEDYIFAHVADDPDILFYDDATMREHFAGTMWNTVSSEANVPVKYEGCMTNLYRHYDDDWNPRPGMVLISRNFTNTPHTRRIVIDGRREVVHDVAGHSMFYVYSLVDAAEKIEVYEGDRLLYEERADETAHWAMT